MLQPYIESATTFSDIFITYAHEIEQSDWSIGVEYISIIHPNIPPMMLGMHISYVAMDTVNLK